MSEAVPAAYSPSRYFTSHQVGSLLQVNPSSVVKWINDGLLHAFRTPGGHRRVSASELVRFAQHHGMPVPEELQGLAITKIVVADDETRWLSAFQRATKPLRNEMELHVADNGIDALILVGALKPDILILDLRMPGLDGFQVLDRIRGNPGTRNMSVIVVSGEMSEQNAQRCRELGAVECLQKPVKLPTLIETIRLVSQRSRTPRAR
jgi:excisionase family DNA binding protein